VTAPWLWNSLPSVVEIRQPHLYNGQFRPSLKTFLVGSRATAVRPVLTAPQYSYLRYLLTYLQKSLTCHTNTNIQTQI